MFASAVENILHERIKDVRAKIVSQMFVAVRSRKKRSGKKACPHLHEDHSPPCLSLFLLKPTLFRTIIPNKLKVYDLYFHI